MKRQISLSIALILGVLLSLASFAPIAYGQEPPRRPVADTGIVSLGQNQVLRLRIVDYLDDDSDFTISFKRMGYIEQNNVYKVFAQDATNPVTLTANEGASIDIPPAFLGGGFVGVRGVVLSSRRNVRVTGQIINTVTGEVSAVLIGLLLP
jgi:hypothetical protein